MQIQENTLYETNVYSYDTNKASALFKYLVYPVRSMTDTTISSLPAMKAGVTRSTCNFPAFVSLPMIWIHYITNTAAGVTSNTGVA